MKRSPDEPAPSKSQGPPRGPLARLLLALIGAYQRRLSPALGRRCRFQPTCSAYAAEAVAELGAVRGSLLAIWRLARCNPFSRGGIDNVADRRLFRHHRHDPGPVAP